MSTNSLVQQCVELLCSDGCKAVRRYIKQLEEGEVVSHTQSLTHTDRDAVLYELKSIMAVYEHASA